MGDLCIASVGSTLTSDSVHVFSTKHNHDSLITASRLTHVARIDADGNMFHESRPTPKSRGGGGEATYRRRSVDLLQLSVTHVLFTYPPLSRARGGPTYVRTAARVDLKKWQLSLEVGSTQPLLWHVSPGELSPGELSQPLYFFWQVPLGELSLGWHTAHRPWACIASTAERIACASSSSVGKGRRTPQGVQ